MTETSGVSTARAPGAILLHPLLLASLFVLVLNDHVLKRTCPGVLTGKLSDFAVVIVLPMFLQGVVELSFARLLRRPLGSVACDRCLVVCLIISLLVFALPEVWKPAEDAYRYGLAVGQWPFKALWASARGQALPGLRPVRATADLTDLLAMPMAYFAFLAAKRGRSLTPSHHAPRAAKPQLTSQKLPLR